MKRHALLLLIFVNAWLGAEQSFQEIADHLRESLAPSIAEKRELGLEIKKCTGDMQEIQDPSLYVFISFSMSDEAILDLAQEVSQVKGVLVLRGIPQNSFKLLAKKFFDLKERGLTAEVQINPIAFQEYSITAIPSFVQTRANGFDKIAGNISLSYALERFSEEGVQ